MNELIKKGEYLDYALETFKGICELNNYPFIKGDNVDIVKYYTFKNDFTSFEVYNKGESKFIDAELINLGVKYFQILGIDDIKLSIKGVNCDVKELIDDLESIEIECSEDNISTDEYDAFAFNLVSSDKRFDKKITIASGGKSNNISALKIDYNVLEKVMPKLSIREKTPIDVYVIPRDNLAFSDALVIGTMLKDAGYKCEVDYREIDFKDKEKYAKNLYPSYILTVSDEFSRSYSVKLKDTLTDVEKVVDINNLVEELDMHI